MPSTVLRRALVLAAAAATLLSASGCEAGRPPAATVEGRDVPAAVVDDMLEALASVEPGFKGQGEGTYGLQGATTVITYLVDRELVLDAVRDRRVKVTAEDRAAGKTNLLSQLGQDKAQAQRVFNRLSKDTRSHLVERESAQVALQADLGRGGDADARARAAYDADRAQFQTACLSALTVADEAAANAAKRRIEGGEDFATVVADVSIDDQAANGGDIGCIPLQQISDPEIGQQIAEAGDGDLVGPFGQPGQIVLVLVREHRQQAFDEVKDQIVAGLPPAGQEELAAFMGPRKEKADIAIDPRYGRWNAKLGVVAPPTAPRGITTTSGPSAGPAGGP